MSDKECEEARRQGLGLMLGPEKIALLDDFRRRLEAGEFVRKDNHSEEGTGVRCGDFDGKEGHEMGPETGATNLVDLQGVSEETVEYQQQQPQQQALNCGQISLASHTGLP